jgi:hypothetical protein
VGTRAALDDVEKRKFLPLLGLELQQLDRPASNQSLYRIRYPSSDTQIYTKKKSIEECKPSGLNIGRSKTVHVTAGRRWALEVACNRLKSLQSGVTNVGKQNIIGILK